MYVNRDAEGLIQQVSRVSTPDCREWVATGSQELDEFLGSERKRGSMGALQSSDLEFVRVLEDVIEVLIDKNLISFTDLPDAAREKLMTRQSLRQRANDVGLLGREDDGII